MSNDINVEEHGEGRPTVMTPEVLRLLDEAFMMGCTDVEACLYANIGKTALYTYQDSHPRFKERKEELKMKPILKARTTVVSRLGNIDHAKWYLERKLKKEFSPRQEVTGEEGGPISFGWNGGKTVATGSILDYEDVESADVKEVNES